jgi:hypothetical protein
VKVARPIKLTAVKKGAPYEAGISLWRGSRIVGRRAGACNRAIYAPISQPTTERDAAEPQSGIVAQPKRGKAVCRLVERNCDDRGESPNRDRVEQRAKLLIHPIPAHPAALCAASLLPLSRIGSLMFAGSITGGLIGLVFSQPP